MHGESHEATITESYMKLARYEKRRMLATQAKPFPEFVYSYYAYIAIALTVWVVRRKVLLGFLLLLAASSSRAIVHIASSYTTVYSSGMHAATIYYVASSLLSNFPKLLFTVTSFLSSMLHAFLPPLSEILFAYIPIWDYT